MSEFPSRSGHPPEPRRGATALRFLALGDSYTAGEGVPWHESWPAGLVRRLRAEGIAIADPVVIARTGWTCDELLEALGPALHQRRVAPPFEMVTLLAGVNDHYRGRDVALWRPSFAALLREARRLSGNRAGRVVVLSVPDWGATPFARDRDRAAIAAGIDELNLVQRQLASAANARWIDVTGPSRAAEQDAALLASDGLHPSRRLYELWVERVLPVARQILGGSD